LKYRCVKHGNAIAELRSTCCELRSEWAKHGIAIVELRSTRCESRSEWAKHGIAIVELRSTRCESRSEWAKHGNAIAELRSTRCESNNVEHECAKYGVSCEEAAIAFDDGLSVTLPASPQSVGEIRPVRIGVPKFGKLLAIAHTDQGEKYELSAPATPFVRNGGFMSREVNTKS
jgi:uncharacterized DUF497 family protein